MNAIYRLPLVAAVIAGAALVAQDSTGALMGTVRNNSGAPIEGVRVGISGGGILTPRVAVTDANGNYVFRILPPGDYTVTISKAGLRGQRATLRVNPGLNTRQDFSTREVGVAVEEIEIVGDTAQAVDKTNTTTVSTFTSEQLRELPVGLSSTGALGLAPGVTQAGDYPAFRGAPGGASQFMVNGISVRDNFLMYGRQTGFVIQDLTESIQVVQSPLNAKYGNSSGGSTNVITKSGTNEFSGSLRVDVDRPDWYTMTQRPQSYRRFNTSPSTNTNPVTNIYVDRNTVGLDTIWRQYQLTLLGPIIPNYLTFSYGRTWSPVNDSTVGIPNIMPNSGNNYGWYVTSLTDPSALLVLGYQFGFTSPTQSYSFPQPGSKDTVDQFKLYYQISPSHQVELYYTQNNLDALDTQFGGSEEDLNRRQNSDRRLLGINYTGVILGGVLEAKYGQTKKQILWPTGPGDPISVMTWRNNYVDGCIAEYSYFARANLLLNGSPGSLEAELRQNESYQANYFWTNNTHNIDVGFERLKETGLVDLYNGPNNRYFYTQGYTVDQKFMVYNWFNSPFIDPAWQNSSNSNRTIFNAIVSSGSGLVPSYRMYDMASGLDYHTYDTADAIYINDLWNINDHWSVMGGLRYENWKIETFRGTELNTSDISPRFEVKYDLRGDNRELFSLSYAHFRGTLGFGTLGAYGRRPSDVRTLYFWNQDMGHQAGEMYAVTREQLLDTGNYAAFRTMNSNFANFISPDVKPEVGKQVEFAYRRAFEDGGFIRGSIVYRRYDDNLYRRGTTTVLWDETDKINPASQLENWLDIDPYNSRRYYGLELEWQVPLYRSVLSNVTANGGWTSARSKGRVTWGDERATTAIRFDDIYAQHGFNIDEYNAFGEYAAGRHNRLNLWVTWNYGRPGEIRSTLSVRGNFTTGEPSSITLTESLPGYGATAATTDTRPRYAPVTDNTPTTLALFLGNRGQFINPDFRYFDVKWSLNIPVWKKVAVFTELTINNFINDVNIEGYNRAQNTTAAVQLFRYTTIDGAVVKNPNYRPEYRMSTALADISVYGRPSSWQRFRTYEFSAGLRF